MSSNTIPKTEYTVGAIWRLEKFILDNLDFEDVVQRTVDSILVELGYLKLGYKIVVLALVDDEGKKLRRIAVSQTKAAKKALELLPIPFPKISIPLRNEKNLSIKVLKTKKYALTNTWEDILTPPLTRAQANSLQKAVGIHASFVCPIVVKGKSIGIMIFSVDKPGSKISAKEMGLILNFTDIVGLAVQNAKLYSSVQDATKRLRKANIRLKELDQLKDEFVSIASHELRTPMTAIKSYLWMAINKSPQKLQDPLKKYLDISYKSTERLIHLVNDMLTVSRIERNKIEIKKERVDVIDVLNMVYEELKITATEKKIDFVFKFDKKEKYIINADKDKIREVFQNLVGNALKFTPNGGKIELYGRKKGNNIEISVSDTGPGILKEDQSKLFQKFSKIDYSYSSHPTQPGTGLGLYISKQIVSLHDGVIHVESDEGKGSKFTVVLPLFSTERETK